MPPMLTQRGEHVVGLAETPRSAPGGVPPGRTHRVPWDHEQFGRDRLGRPADSPRTRGFYGWPRSGCIATTATAWWRSSRPGAIVRMCSTPGRAGRSAPLPTELVNPDSTPPRAPDHRRRLGLGRHRGVVARWATFGGPGRARTALRASASRGDRG